MAKRCSLVSTVRDKDEKTVQIIQKNHFFLGVRECDGNKFQSCCLDVIGQSDKDRQTSFVICAMDFSKNPNNCAQNLGLDMNKVNECVNGEKGIALQLKAEEDSKNIIAASGFVPTIVYQNRYQAGDFWASLEDFEGVVKDRLEMLA